MYTEAVANRHRGSEEKEILHEELEIIKARIRETIRKDNRLRATATILVTVVVLAAIVGMILIFKVKT